MRSVSAVLVLLMRLENRFPTSFKGHLSFHFHVNLVHCKNNQSYNHQLYGSIKLCSIPCIYPFAFFSLVFAWPCGICKQLCACHPCSSFPYSNGLTLCSHHTDSSPELPVSKLHLCCLDYPMLFSPIPIKETIRCSKWIQNLLCL